MKMQVWRNLMWKKYCRKCQQVVSNLYLYIFMPYTSMYNENVLRCQIALNANIVQWNIACPSLFAKNNSLNNEY